MPQTRPCDVSPQGDQDKYSIALMNQSGEWYGLDIPLAQIYPKTSNAPTPIERIALNSFHAGRGFDRFVPKQDGFYDSLNGWSSTKGKFHPTLQQQWARNLRNADFNMPKTNKVVWKKLVGSQAYLAAAFTPGVNYTATKIIAIIRKNVPAGTVGAPGEMALAIYSNSSGLPGSLISFQVITASAVDVTSEYYVFSVSAALTGGNQYWVVANANVDKDNACWEIACDPTVAGAKKAGGGSFSSTTFAPYFRVTDDDPARQYKPFIFDSATYLVSIEDNGSTASRLWINGTRGRATGTQTSTTLKDTNRGSWGPGAMGFNYAGAYIRIIRGTGKGQVRKISVNDGDTFTVTQAWSITPVSGSSEYVVYATEFFVEIGSTGFGVVSGSPVIQNSIAYFPQGDATVIRKMRIDYTDADCHAFGSENATNNNKGYFLESAYDLVEGPQIWKANQVATSGSTPNAAAISVARAPTAPNKIPVAFTADVLFNSSFLAGDNTNLITNIFFHENALYVFKEDGLFMIQNNQAVQVKLGVETSPDVDNGRAVCTGGDKNMYFAFRNDVYIMTNGGAYSTNLKFNLPSERSGPISSLIAAEGWVFAAVNGGTSNTSSVMKFSIDTKTWSEQLRGHFPGYRMRNLQWQVNPETRPRLWVDVEGDMMFQEFPLNGVRPYDDKTIPYQHEGSVILPTVDLGTTDPKYFAVLNVTTQGLAQETDTESGHVIVVECQTDNDVGTNIWEHVDYIKVSPTAAVEIGRGNKRMIRIRLRLISDEPTDPVIVETINMSLYTRSRLAHSWSVQFPINPDDDEQNSVDLLMWLRDAYRNPEPLEMLSRFTLFHNRTVTLVDEPRYQLSELDQPNNELEAQVWMELAEVI